jgi:hypothetical protein
MISKLARFTLVPLFAVALTSGVALAQDPPAEGEAAPPAEGMTETAPPTEAAPVEAAPAEEGGMAMEKKMWLGADGGLLVPLLGDYPDAAGIGFAVHLDFSYNVSPVLQATARAGYHHHLAKNEITVSNIPVLAGVKYWFGKMFASAEVGISNNKVKFGGASASKTKFASAVGVGYAMNALEIRVGAFMPETAKTGDGIDLMATVGYNFMGF